MAIIGSLMNGFFLIPVIPIMLDFACELVYPIGDSHAMGILIAGGQLWGFVMGFIITAIVGNEPT
jgi:FLVCR family feline leukemia virus subgroup C receptor-related protein